MLILLLLSGWFSTAQANSFALSPQWLNLLHYQTTLKGFESEADGPLFFLAKDGKTNPDSELSATIKALQDTETLRGTLRQPAACVFPARKKIIQQNLNIVFPKVDCPDYENWRKALPVTEISMVFATAYPNNPASMFGHTFIRLKGPGEGKDLLDYIVNFAATTGSAGGVEFAVFGVFGGYQGHYSLAPYFIKVNEYNNSEARDLWEYPLKLSANSIDLLIAHIWEIEASTWFDYWFFDENCSWQLIRLLEAVDPSLKLSAKAPFYIIPGETIRILDSEKILGAPTFRPSLRRQYLERKKPQNEIEATDKKLAYYQLKSRLKKLSLDDEKKYHQELSKRSKVSAPPTLVDVPIALNSPHLGHGLARIKLTAGENFQQFQGRFAQHDLLDSDVGHEPWSQLDILRATFELSDNFFIRELILADVISLTPLNDLNFSPSWFVKFGAESPWFFETQHLAAIGDAGIGASIGNELWLASLMGTATTYSDSPEGGTIRGGARMLAGAKYKSWKLLLDIRRQFQKLVPWQNSISLSWNLNHSWATQTQILFNQKQSVQSGVSILYYF